MNALERVSVASTLFQAQGTYHGSEEQALDGLQHGAQHNAQLVVAQHHIRQVKAKVELVV